MTKNLKDQIMLFLVFSLKNNAYIIVFKIVMKCKLLKKIVSY